MSFISEVVGDVRSAANYSDTASSYYSQWEEMAVDPSGLHTMLAYQSRGTHGLLYNTFPDKLLNLGIIPQHLYEMQSEWYPTISQVFGVSWRRDHSALRPTDPLVIGSTRQPSPVHEK